MKNSITSKNTEITHIADILQNARNVLVESNTTILSEADTRRIILLCTIYVYLCDSLEISSHYSLKNLLKELGFDHTDNSVVSTDISCNRIELSSTLNELLRIQDVVNWKDLIEYAFESLEYRVNDYFNVELQRGIRSKNKKKKAFGVYYTPDDVTAFITSRCIQATVSKKKYPLILDCSCGSGVFLVSCMSVLDDLYNGDGEFEKSLRMFRKCIWGIDISSAAIDICRATFSLYFIKRFNSTGTPISDIWNIVDEHFAVGDSSKLGTIINDNVNFPKQFDCIVGNPPYVTRGKDDNTYIDFVNNLIDYSSDNGCSALVLPLSICFSHGKRYVELRSRIQNDNAKWEFFNFDRSPDSLFGDQVKTRNTIVFRTAGKSTNSIYTTSLLRWTSANRANLFCHIDQCNISGISLSEGIPKMSGLYEKAMFNALSHGKSCLRELFLRNDNHENILVMNGTAYNWLGVYDHYPPSTDENGNPYISASTKTYYLGDEKMRNFGIALLCNRIAYWYWIVIGDGFHFNTSFLDCYHIGVSDFSPEEYERLCILGEQYSRKIKTSPTTSYNAGKTIVNYSHMMAMDIVQEIECIILTALNLPDSYGKQIEQWYDNQVCCNRV